MDLTTFSSFKSKERKKKERKEKEGERETFVFKAICWFDIAGTLKEKKGTVA